MPVKIIVPELGESILEATVGHWRKREGDPISQGEVLVDLETDKVDLEVGAEQQGVLAKIERKKGEDVHIGDVLGVIEEGEAAARPTNGAAPVKQPESAPAAAAAAQPSVPATPPLGETSGMTAEQVSTPSARRLAREQGLNLAGVAVGAPGARVTREEVKGMAPSPKLAAVAQPAQPQAAPAPGAPVMLPSREPAAAGREERMRMSRRRMTIAQRLLEAQHSAALLTTFNEVDMSAIMEVRKRRKEAFEKRHGVSLGIVSFFVKASVAALRLFPKINAEIQGDEIVLKHYYDIGVAVGAAEGLVVPVLRNADEMSFAEIEAAVKDHARKAREGALSLADLRGGTFSITNGGVFGSLLSTPIVNPPQPAILGLHKIEERPVALRGEVVIRPMMYVALTYDHRIIDGLEAVQFLARVKEFAEDPGT
ncbi:MAG: 2-oxoglutarate dehydrogenase complex dihydrolipoyllysine-residue succinyltransferase, partial [Terriglobia bacterium]